MLKVALAVADAVKGAADLAIKIYEYNKGGFTITANSASYPKELNGFLDAGTLVNRQVLKFVGDGYVWNTELGVSMSGSFSSNNDELVCFDEIPGIPANRFLRDVKFFESPHSDDVSQSELKVNIEAQQDMFGSADDPRLAFRVNGRFNPVGTGNAGFAFMLLVDSYGQVYAQDVDVPDAITVTDKGSYIEIYLNQ